MNTRDLINSFDPKTEDRRSEFRRRVSDLLDAQKDDVFFELGDVSHELEKGDWRLTEINRALTRYREDRPIRDAQRLAQVALADARWWARLAILIALIALASSVVTAIADGPHAWENLVKLADVVSR